MDWQSLLGVPLFTAAALALIPLLIPTFRWNRQISRDVQLWKDMPAGEEKDLLEVWITEQATRIREYREYIPLHDKVIGWATVVVLGVLWIQLGPMLYPVALSLESKYPAGIALSAAIFFYTVFALIPTAIAADTVVSMPRGRSFRGMTPRRYREVEDRRRELGRRGAVAPVQE